MTHAQRWSVLAGLLLLVSLPARLAAATAPSQASSYGIGIQMGPAAGGMRIMAVVPGGPADRAGLHAGDLIVEVDGLNVDGLGAITNGLIRGSKGTAVRLLIASADGRRRTVRIVRAMAMPATVPSGPVTARRGPAEAPRATPTAAAAPGGGVRFVSWTEPNEHSFSVDVPQGWTLSGGLNWTGPIDPQAFVRVQSPDGKVQIFLGDPEILPRQVPSQWTALQTGATEGGVFRSPTGGRALLQRFLTGTQFGKMEVVQRHCQNPRWVTETDLPDRARAINAALTPEARKWNANMSVSAGEAGFICGNVQGSVSATTVLGWGNGPTQAWFVQSLAVFLSADPMRSMQARYIMEHMMATSKADPRWEQAFEQHVRAVTGAVISMQNAALQAQLSSARSASDSLSRLNHPNPGVNVRPGDRRATSVNTTLGTEDVCDAIGRCQSVSTDSDTYFIDHSGNVRPGRPGGAPPDNTGVWSPTYVR